MVKANMLRMEKLTKIKYRDFERIVVSLTYTGRIILGLLFMIECFSLLRTCFSPFFKAGFWILLFGGLSSDAGGGGQ